MSRFSHPPADRFLSFAWVLLLAIGIAFSWPQISRGQAVLPGAGKAPQGKGKPGKIEIPKPDHVTLTTTDNVQLACTYYAPPIDPENRETGKSAVPYLLIHDWEGSRENTYQLALFLQSKGHAAMIFDLRGHGASTRVEGRDSSVDYDKFNRQEMNSVILDIECCKKFLVQKNNAGELNIDLLTVLAIGEMAPVAAQWVVNDWYQFPAFNAEGIKQGQDVKMLILVAPRKKFSNYSLTTILKHALFIGGAQRPLPVMLVWSEDDDDGGKDAKSIYTALDKVRGEENLQGTKEERLAAATLFKADIERSELTGTQLISDQRITGLWEYIASTSADKIKLQLEERPWASREKPETP